MCWKLCSNILALQVMMNCQHHSTVVLDFTGGAFSILQMFIISYNYSESSSMYRTMCFRLMCRFGMTRLCFPSQDYLPHYQGQIL